MFSTAKKKLLLLPVLLCFAARGQSPTDTGLFFQEKKGWLAWQRPQQATAKNNYDIIYTRCEWKIDPAVLYIRGAVTSWFRPGASGFTSMEFDLSAALTVDSVKYHGQRLDFSHYSWHILKIGLPTPLTAGQKDSLTIFYGGKPVGSGMGSFAQGTHSNTPALWTLSEPYGARDWWPCKQDLADKIDSIDLVVTCPQQYKVAANGLLMSEVINGNDKTCHWKSRYPIATYLVAIAATNYVVFTQTLTVPTGTVPIVNYVYPEFLMEAQEQAKGITDIMRLFDSLFIPYPFSKEKYGHAQFGWGGGMEHQTMSFMYGLDFALMAHECAHHWFGDHVTCGSWQEIWLNEGFATYLEGLCAERYSAGAVWLDWRTSKIREITSKPDGSVFCEDTSSVGRVFDHRLTYFKGAYLLRMLRWKTGDDAFFKGLKNYLNDPKIAGRFGKTSYLREHLEITSGMNLRPFFDQWYYGQGHPSYGVEWKQSGKTITVTITQETSHQSVPFFAMPVPVLFTGTNRDTLLVFDHLHSGQQFTAEVPFEVLQATFDPEFQLLSKNNRVSAIYELKSGKVPLEVVPNPALDKLSVRLLTEADRIRSLRISDALGKNVIDVASSLSLSSCDVDVSTLPQGVYFVTVKTGRGWYRTKFVKL